jgi:hypothetical protein
VELQVLPYQTYYNVMDFPPHTFFMGDSIIKMISASLIGSLISQIDIVGLSKQVT